MCGSRWWNSTNGGADGGVPPSGAELRGTPSGKAKTHTGKLLLYQSHAKDVIMPGASCRTKEELDQVVEPLCSQAAGRTVEARRMRRAISSTGRKQTRRSAPRVWHLIANPRSLPKEFVQKELSSGGSCSRRRRRKPNEQQLFQQTWMIKGSSARALSHSDVSEEL